MTNDIAIFLDLDNLVIGSKQADMNFDIELVLNHIKQLTNGRVVLRKAYGDWRQNNKILQELTKAGFHTHSHMRLNNYTKNLADMQIVVETMETLVDGQLFSTYVLMTGDRDFTPLVQSLRKRGKRVIGVGLRHTASQSFVELCDDYLYYEDLLPKPQLNSGDVAQYLDQALEQLLQDEPRVRASVLKQRLLELSGGEFVKVQLGHGSFSKFLEKYSDRVMVEQEGSTTYVRRPAAVTPDRPLHLRYRTELKKMRLRVISPKDRIRVIRDIVSLLQQNSNLQWRELIDTLFERYTQEDTDISKNVINAVMLVARQSNVVRTIKARSLSTAPLQLEIDGSRATQVALLRCDETYLRAILDLAEPFDLEQAALALYEDVKYSGYLQAIMNRWQQDLAAG